jgi:hypothetical protein
MATSKEWRFLPRRERERRGLRAKFVMKTHEAYQALPTKVAQWVLRLLDQN